jgi:hypothetical protein
MQKQLKKHVLMIADRGMPLVFLLSVIFFVLFSTVISASSPPEDEIKAAFVFNFAKFVEWPGMNDKKSLRVCFAGKNAFSGNLQLLEGRQIQNLRLTVCEFSPDMAEECDILVIPESEKQNLDELLELVNDKPVLTISDAGNFVHDGGIIGLIRLDNKVRFEINLLNAKKSHLKISSHGLDLPRVVK